jgi:hypothetical protein
MVILKQFPGRYLTVEGLEDMGGEFTGAITKVGLEDMKTPGQPDDKKPVAYLEGLKPGFVINKSNATTLAEALGRNTTKWAGREIVIRLEQWGPAAAKKKWMAAYVGGNFQKEHRPPSAKEVAGAAQAPLDDLEDDISDL